MKHRFRIMGWLAVSLVLSSCIKREATPLEQVLVKVNGEPVFLQEFLVNFKQIKGEQDNISQKNPKLMEELKTRTLNELIILTLLRTEAERRKLKIAREEAEARLANWADSYPPGGFAEMLRKQNTTEAFIRKRIEDQLLVEKVSEALAGAEALVSDEEAKSYYEVHKSEFTRPERVHAFQIVVPTKEEAEKIRAELIAGKMSFESAARQFSLSPDAAKGGDLGFFSRNEKIDAFNAAFDLTTGTISKPIESRYGVHLLKVVEKTPTKKLTFNEAKEGIGNSIRQLRKMRAYKEWVIKRLKDGEIYRNETLYTSIN